MSLTQFALKKCENSKPKKCKISAQILHKKFANFVQKMCEKVYANSEQKLHTRKSVRFCFHGSTEQDTGRFSSEQKLLQKNAKMQFFLRNFAKNKFAQKP